MVSCIWDTVEGHYQDGFIHQGCLRTLGTKGRGDFRVICAE